LGFLRCGVLKPDPGSESPEPVGGSGRNAHVFAWRAPVASEHNGPGTEPGAGASSPADGALAIAVSGLAVAEQVDAAGYDAAASVSNTDDHHATSHHATANHATANHATAQ
jgi:hypothetical protein